jgi:hypothetical protein
MILGFNLIMSNWVLIRFGFVGLDEFYLILNRYVISNLKYK